MAEVIPALIKELQQVDKKDQMLTKVMNDLSMYLFFKNKKEGASEMYLSKLEEDLKEYSSFVYETEVGPNASKE